MSDDIELVFIYNANSGVISTIKDIWKKILRPSSYQCNLCTQTFGVFSMKKDWKEFIKRLKINVEFLHRDEFEEKYKIDDAKYPSAYLKQNGILSLLITQEEIDSVKSLDEMETLVLGKINILN